MVEEWRDVKGWEGFYQASSLGRIRSVERKIALCDGRERIQPSIVLKPTRARGSYRKVTLTKNGKTVNRSIHRLVAEAFLPKSSSDLEVNHKDGDPTNNAVSNLEWSTRRENALHRVHVLHKQGRAVKCVETGEIFYSIKRAAECYDGDPSQLCKLLNHSGQTFKGKHWRLING